METKFNQQGDLYYDDCAYIEIEYSPIGQFTGEQLSEPLLINFLKLQESAHRMGYMQKMMVHIALTESLQNAAPLEK